MNGEKMENILLIEDNLQMQKYVADFLMAQNYNVKILEDYDNIVEEVRLFSPKLILLDINLPKYDGFFYLKLLRKHYDIPIIILSARSDESEQIRGIENGANDYITKPFSINILLAKINALFLREKDKVRNESNVLVGDLEIDSTTFKVTYKGREIDLTKNEFKILIVLVKRVGEVVSRNQLLEQLWDDTTFVDDNTLTVNVSRLKKKLQEVGLDEVIQNKRGVGYAFIYN